MNFSPSNCTKAEDDEEAYKKFNAIFLHSTRCRDANCRHVTCAKLKTLFAHVRTCEIRSEQNRRPSSAACPSCKTTARIMYKHANGCVDRFCALAWCGKLKLQNKLHSGGNGKTDADASNGTDSNFVATTPPPLRENRSPSYKNYCAIDSSAAPQMIDTRQSSGDGCSLSRAQQTDRSPRATTPTAPTTKTANVAAFNEYERRHVCRTMSNSRLALATSTSALGAGASLSSCTPTPVVAECISNAETLLGEERVVANCSTSTTSLSPVITTSAATTATNFLSTNKANCAKSPMETTKNFAYSPIAPDLLLNNPLTINLNNSSNSNQQQQHTFGGNFYFQMPGNGNLAPQQQASGSGGNYVPPSPYFFSQPYLATNTVFPSNNRSTVIVDTPTSSEPSKRNNADGSTFLHQPQPPYYSSALPQALTQQQTYRTAYAPQSFAPNLATADSTTTGSDFNLNFYYDYFKELRNRDFGLQQHPPLDLSLPSASSANSLANAAASSTNFVENVVYPTAPAAPSSSSADEAFNSVATITVENDGSADLATTFSNGKENRSATASVVDDDVIEIIAEVKNVEVVAEMPNAEDDLSPPKAKRTRRSYSKQTKAVVEAAEEDFTCCVCLKPFESPMLCLDCKKITGCKKCIDGWGRHCPACRGTTGTMVVRGLDKLSAKLREYDDCVSTNV